MEWGKREIGLVLAATFLLTIGTLGAGYFIGKGFYQSRMADRFVTVKGLAEKDVVADLAVWNIKLAATGDILTDVQGNIERQKKELMSFLKEQEISDNEIGDGQLNVTDLMAQQYRAQGSEQSRFIITYSITLRTTDINKMKTISGRVGDIVKKGLVLMENTGPNYIFTKLNEIKPEMIAIATKNARKSAEQFAADSGSGVGSIRRASQGVFSIEARDGSSVEAPEGMMFDREAKQIEKKIRVVSTIDYYLAN